MESAVKAGAAETLKKAICIWGVPVKCNTNDPSLLIEAINSPNVKVFTFLMDYYFMVYPDKNFSLADWSRLLSEAIDSQKMLKVYEYCEATFTRMSLPLKECFILLSKIVILNIDKLNTHDINFILNKIKTYPNIIDQDKLLHDVVLACLKYPSYNCFNKDIERIYDVISNLNSFGYSVKNNSKEIINIIENQSNMYLYFYNNNKMTKNIFEILCDYGLEITQEQIAFIKSKNPFISYHANEPTDDKISINISNSK